jgi:hypothetical protein
MTVLRFTTQNVGCFDSVLQPQWSTEMPRRKPKFPVSTRVVDIETGAHGVVVHIFRDPMLADTRVVRFGSARE